MKDSECHYERDMDRQRGSTSNESKSQRKTTNDILRQEKTSNDSERHGSDGVSTNDIMRSRDNAGHPKKVSAELFLCFLLVFIVVLFRHGA